MLKRLVSTCLLACTLSAPIVAAHAEQSAQLTVLQGARIIDGSGGAPIEGGSLVIRNDRIDAIVAPGAAVPAGARIVDLHGKTLMPALIAAHTHLGLTQGTQSGAAQITEENVERQLRKFMAYGIGTVASFGTDHDFIYALREKRRQNAIQTPTILTAGRGFGMVDGAPPINAGLDQVYRPATIPDVDRDVDELSTHRPDLVKVWVDDFGHTMPAKMDPALYREVISRAHRDGLKVAAHLYYIDDARRLLADGIDIFGHGVRDKPLDQATIGAMKQRDIGYIPTLSLDEASFVYADDPRWMHDDFFRNALDAGVWEWLHSPAYKAKGMSREDLAIGKRNALALLRAGVRVGVGADSGAMLARIQGFGEHRELQLLVEAGFTPMQALLAGTSVNASILGIANERGQLAAGKKADILVLDANPLDDIRNTETIHSLWLEGVEVPR
jgi:imidazolonepropionase-like amidohydrolase